MRRIKASGLHAFIGSPSRVRLSLILLLTNILLLSTANAQRIATDCAPKDAIRANLLLLKSADEKLRSTASRSLIDSWQTSLPTIISEIANFRRDTKQTQWPAEELNYAIQVTGVIRAVLTTNDYATSLFRQCDSDRVVKPLIWAARGDNRELRVAATNILADIVDNTTICFVLHHLQSPNIADSGRANLLGISKAVGSYVYDENASAVTETLKKLEGRVSNELVDTKRLMLELQERVSRSRNKGQQLPSILAEYCKGFDYDKPLD